MSFVIDAFAFLVKHWKLALLVLALGGMGAEGFHLARSWDREAALVAQAATLKNRLLTISILQSSDSVRAKADAEQLEKLKEAADETPPDTRPGLDRAAVGRLRSIR